MTQFDLQIWNILLIILIICFVRIFIEYRKFLKYKKLHFELWDWLVWNPDEAKQDWPEWSFRGGEVESVNRECFACEFNNHLDIKDCKTCPIVIFRKNPCSRYDSTNPFYYYIHSDTHKKQYIVNAYKQIRDAKWRFIK